MITGMGLKLCFLHFLMSRLKPRPTNHFYEMACKSNHELDKIAREPIGPDGWFKNCEGSRASVFHFTG
jgi:hypothetical protein